ncbi:adenosylcobinamide-GDP ribazoletransferase [Reinekea marinisedimentorum]|uniref:Adenosylcobinamide-GDP ribazoletransferase n=1 Tax=Reinekea marinisedimentorum TaxID=230495 RepID=A0A4R3I8D6_9GAMM|nr:adenosylcobinamide-GDP ribazoletransferase [Reinekea marinisedimentorum]TCS41582.1 adenosylcobinamide-GDP ribazoletransferase [Reinekea marinisedimentorum]
MIRDFLLALGFFTRIPVPAHPNYSDDAMRRSALYYPLVGLFVGALLAAIYGFAQLFWSVEVSVLLTLSAGFLLTGGFHEDGWADTFDGFGGAFNKERKLDIMTDSRLGTYGSLALWAMLSLKAFTLFELLPQAGVICLIVAHCLSRWSSMTAMVFADYVRVNPSKAKPVVSQMSFGRWLAALLFSLPALVFVPLHIALVLTVTALIVAALWIWQTRRQIGGYTGDTMGAGQQLAELALYLVWLCF